MAHFPNEVAIDLLSTMALKMKSLQDSVPVAGKLSWRSCKILLHKNT